MRRFSNLRPVYPMYLHLIIPRGRWSHFGVNIDKLAFQLFVENSSKLPSSRKTKTILVAFFKEIIVLIFKQKSRTRSINLTSWQRKLSGCEASRKTTNSLRVVRARSLAVPRTNDRDPVTSDLSSHSPVTSHIYRSKILLNSTQPADSQPSTETTSSSRFTIEYGFCWTFFRLPWYMSRQL